ncbi:MAG: hypothetical protein A2Z09_02210 [Nitrospirae bacterium RBG_16_43_8]|nr:MAG: hypothetical protein A2Z09_02210 [Nitrospirae bacterium RBG_16_43_8]
MKFKDRFRNILAIMASPHRLAVVFAAGVFIGMSPLLGFHTILGIAAVISYFIIYHAVKKAHSYVNPS